MAVGVSVYGMSDMTLRAARKKAGLNKSQLAHLARTHRMTIDRLETNESRPLHDTVQRLETALSSVISAPITLRFPRRAA